MSNKTITQAHDEINDQQLNDVVGGATHVATAYRVPTSSTLNYNANLSLDSQIRAKSTSLI